LFRAGLALTSLFVASFLAAAQSNSVRVEGTILNSVTGEPVLNANLSLRQNGNAIYSQSSGDKGMFVFENVAPGLYALAAQKSGYRQQANPIGPVMLNVITGQSLEKLEIKLLPQGVIAGRVMDQGGNPMVQTQVVWFQYAYVQGKKRLQRRIDGLFAASESQTTTNDKGEYRFASLAPGEYFVAAIVGLPTVRGADGGSQERNVTTFYPSVIDPAAVLPVRVTAGAEFRDTNIHVRRAAVYSIRGKVVGEARSIGQVTLVLSSTDGPAQGLTRLRPDGSFEFPYVVPGRYALKAQLGGSGILGSRVPCVGCSDFRVTNSNLDDLMLQLGPAAASGISGTIRAEGIDLQGSQVSVGLSEIDEYQSIGGRVWLVNDGAFRIQSGAAKYFWRVNGLPPGTYIKSARFNGQDVTNKVLDTTNSGGANLEVVVSTKVAELAGAVVDANRALKAGVRMTLWLKTDEPANANGGVYGSATDQNGGFRISDLAPGSYYAAAWEEILPPGLGNSLEFLSRFNGEATTVTLEEGGQGSLNAKLISAQRIAAEIAKLP
jgi:hypothetical protein